MWYLFPVYAVNRMLPQDGEISVEWRSRLTTVFGTDEWEEAFYSRRTVAGLFGTDELVEKMADFDHISRFVLDRLRAEFGDCCVAANARVLRNSRNSPLFLLCFAAGNKKGAPIAIRIAEHILGK